MRSAQDVAPPAKLTLKKHRPHRVLSRSDDVIRGSVVGGIGYEDGRVRRACKYTVVLRGCTVCALENPHGRIIELRAHSFRAECTRRTTVAPLRRAGARIAKDSVVNCTGTRTLRKHSVQREFWVSVLRHRATSKYDIDVEPCVPRAPRSDVPLSTGPR